MRAALRLSWVEVRHLGRVRRYDERAAGERLQAQGAADGVSDLRAGWDRVGVSGAGGAYAAAAEIRLDTGAGSEPARDEGDPGVQLAAGSGRRHRHVTCADHAPAAERDIEARRVQAVQSVRARQGTEPGGGYHRLWLSVRGDTAARR